MEPTDNELPDSLTEMPLIDRIMPTLLPALQVSLLGLYTFKWVACSAG